MIVRALQGETLDALCLRALGRTAGVTEAALVANPGLAGVGPFLPTGYAVTLHDAVMRVPVETGVVQLWT